METVRQEGLCMQNIKQPKREGDTEKKISEKERAQEESKDFERAGTQEESKDSERAGTQKESKDSKKKRTKTGKLLCRFIAAAILISTVLTTEYLASMSFSDVHSRDYFVTDIHRLEKENAQVDMIITGASQVYYGYNPDTISREMGIGEVIDCASASATNDSIYYMLKDLLERFEPKYVVLNFSWNAFIEKKGGGNLKGQLIAGDRILLSNRLQLYKNCIDPSEWMNLSYMYRYGSTIWGLSQLKYYYDKRKAVFNDEWKEESERKYRKNGYLSANTSCATGSMKAERHEFNPDRINEYMRSYAEKMVELCREKGIKTFIVSAPASANDLYGVKNYQGSADYTEAFARDMGCEYLNFSLLKNRESIFPDESFQDNVHLNKEGAETYSRILAETLNKILDGEDVSSMFYENIDAMKKDVHRIVGSNGKAHYAEDGSVQVSVFSHQNDDVIPEYRLVLTDEEEHESRVDETETETLDEAETDVQGEDDPGDGDNTAEDKYVKENASNKSESNSSKPENEVETGTEAEIELRTWQTETEFVIDASELTPGKNLRLEVRKAGENTAEAYQENILEYVI